jgi:hypothetical protein
MYLSETHRHSRKSTVGLNLTLRIKQPVSSQNNLLFYQRKNLGRSTSTTKTNCSVCCRSNASKSSKVRTRRRCTSTNVHVCQYHHPHPNQQHLIYLIDATQNVSTRCFALLLPFATWRPVMHRAKHILILSVSLMLLQSIVLDSRNDSNFTKSLSTHNKMFTLALSQSIDPSLVTLYFTDRYLSIRSVLIVCVNCITVVLHSNLEYIAEPTTIVRTSCYDG